MVSNSSQLELILPEDMKFQPFQHSSHSSLSSHGGNPAVLDGCAIKTVKDTVVNWFNSALNKSSCRKWKPIEVYTYEMAFFIIRNQANSFKQMRVNISYVFLIILIILGKFRVNSHIL